MRDDFDEVSETLYGVNKRLRFIQGVLSECGDPGILDVGCGTGALLTLPLARRGWRITGLDIHAGSVESAEAASPPNAQFLCGTLADISGLYDVIIFSEVLEHVAEPCATLRALRAKLRPGGRLILTVPNGRGPFEIDQWFWKRNFLFMQSLYRRYVARRGPSAVTATFNEDSPHINFFTRPVLDDLLKTAGFRIVEYRARTFIAGDYPSIFGHALNMFGVPTGWFTRWNALACDWLPARFASGWMFVCELV